LGRLRSFAYGDLDRVGRRLQHGRQLQFCAGREREDEKNQS